MLIAAWLGLDLFRRSVMKFVVMALAVTALLSGCVSRTYEKETVVDPQRPASSTVVVPQGATAPSGTTVVVPQNAPPPPSGDTTIIVPR
jgi:ABC-type uncharacterized transport system auxiliary subunit